jgi:hypothetical protein
VRLIVVRLPEKTV